MVGNEAPPPGQSLTPHKTRASVSSRLADWMFAPTLALIMQNRWFLALIAGLAIVQVGRAAAGWRGWQCPIHFISGVPCPGCGLSRATALFIQGKWQTAIEVHAFAPILAVAIGFLTIAAIMPRSLQHRAVRRVAAWERRSGIVAFVVLAMFIYWGLRLSGVLGYMPVI